MSKLPYFKFYPQDFLVGTSFMTPAEVGGYIRLLCVSWEKGGIPRDNKIISRITGCDTEENLNILDKFVILDDLFINERLEEVRKELELFSNKQSNRAKKRWDATAMPRDATAMPSQKSEVISQNTEVRSQESKVIKENTCAEKSARYDYINEFDFLWEKYPNKLGKKEALKHFKASVKNDDDIFNINKALDNYMLEIKVKDIGSKYIKHGSSWFNCWQDYIERVVENDKRIGGIRLSEINDLIANAPE